MEKDLLLHICCAPCLTFTHEELDRLEIPFDGYWYNPNIHPYTEYKKRMHALQRYTSLKPLKIIYDDEYDVRRFLTKSLDLMNSDDIRCKYCYDDRLTRTARYAKENGYRRFSTTLLFSKYQRHDLIKAAGERAGQEIGIEFYYIDLRSGWKRSLEICKEFDIYRQGYCGCILSEEERYSKSRNGE